MGCRPHTDSRSLFFIPPKQQEVSRMRKWRIEDSEELYNIKGWGVNYFGINEKGHVYVTPRKDGVKVRIVSAPSEGLFRTQPAEYQNDLLPNGAKIFGLTAGLPVNLQGLVGANGKVFGLETFGYSAPYKVLDEKLGFTAENVYNQVKAML